MSVYRRVLFFYSNEIGAASAYGPGTSASAEASAAYGDTESKKGEKISIDINLTAFWSRKSQVPLELEAAELVAELAQQMRTQSVATLPGPLSTGSLSLDLFSCLA